MADLVRESFGFSGGKVDRSGPYPVIHDVLICGAESKWGYPYLKEAWTDDTLKAYEGLPSFVNHADDDTKPRDVTDKLGWFKGVGKDAAGQPRGIYCLNPKHPLAESVLWAAEHNPTFYAMSHTAAVKWGTRNGKRVVEGILKPVSVDLVGTGATTKGLHEHAPPGGTTVASTVKEYANKLGTRCTVEQLIRLRELVKEGFGDVPMPDTAPDAATAEPEDGITAAFKQLMHAHVDALLDESQTLPEFVTKVKALYKSQGKEAPGEKEPKEDAPEEKAAKEAAAAALAAKNVVKEADPGVLLTELAKEGFTPTMSQLAALKNLPDAPTRAAFIKEQKGFMAAKAPRSAGRETVAEGGGADDQAAKDREAALERARKLACENQGVKYELKK